MTNQLYEFALKVARGQSRDMPEGMNGALVPTFAAALDHEAAVRKGVIALRGMGYEFEDLHGEIREIPADRWSDYVAATWPEFATSLPTAEQLPGLIDEGVVFFGPFLGFERYA